MKKEEDDSTFIEYFDFFEKVLVDAGISIIHYAKLKKQTEFIINLLKNDVVGYLEAVTGFGKSYVAIFTILRLHNKYKNAKVTVIVPSKKLKEDWCSSTGYIQTFGLHNVSVYIVNTYTMLESEDINYNTDFLICDELHNYCSSEAEYFNKVLDMTTFKFFLGLSATLDKEQKEFLKKFKIPQIGNVTIQEARANNYISDFTVYNYGIELSKQQRDIYNEISERHNKYYNKFMVSEIPYEQFNLALACNLGSNVTRPIAGIYKTGKQWREWIATEKGYNGSKEHPFSPNNIYVYAKKWQEAMLQRKSFLDKHKSKIIAVSEIIKRVKGKTITFSESTEFVDLLSQAIPYSASYHSNIESLETYEEFTEYRKTLSAAKKLRIRKNGHIGDLENNKGYPITYKKKVIKGKTKILRENIKKFENGIYTTLNTAKALDEGADIPDITCVILTSGTSKRRQYIQRLGRGLRFIEGKKTIIVNVYIKDTKDESWLKQRQKKNKTPIMIDNVSQINLDKNVNISNLLFNSN